jgi:iron complex transport system substrate-binding protein
VASLLASGTELVHALGRTDDLVAVSHECDYPPEIAGKPRVTSAAITATASSREIDTQVRDAVAAGGALYDVDWATLAKLRPDVLITQAHCAVCAVNYDDVCRAVVEVPELHAARIVALEPDNLAAVFDDLQRVGEALDCPADAEQAAAGLRRRIETVRHSCSSGRRPRVVCLEWTDPLMIAGNWMPELIELAGGTTLTEGGARTTYSRWEEVVAFDPEVLIVGPCGFDLERSWNELAALENLAGWKDLSAAKQDRIWAVDGNAYFNRSGPRLIDTLEILAALLHPERQSLSAAGQSAVRQRRGSG